MVILNKLCTRRSIGVYALRHLDSFSAATVRLANAVTYDINSGLWQVVAADLFECYSAPRQDKKQRFLGKFLHLTLIAPV
jgi:hypothetical protein